MTASNFFKSFIASVKFSSTIFDALKPNKFAADLLYNFILFFLSMTTIAVAKFVRVASKNALASSNLFLFFLEFLVAVSS